MPRSGAVIAAVWWALGSLAWTQAAEAPSAQVIPPQFFGLHFRRDKIAWPPIPFGSLRLWDTDTRWQQLNPSPGQFRWAVLDDYLRTAREHGVTEVMLTLSSTPQWASSEPANQSCDYGGRVAPGPAGDCSPPSDLNPDGSGSNQHWRDFVYALSAHVAGLDSSTHASIQTFGMWNEFTRPAAWTGTNPQLVRLAQDARCILTGRGTITTTGQICNAANLAVPRVGLLPGAMVGTPEAVASEETARAFGAYMKTPGALEAAELVVVHAYAYSAAPPAGAEALAERWHALARELPPQVLSRPLVSSEGSWGDTAVRLPDADSQMAYLARYFLLGRSLGYCRMYWYAADNSWGRLIRQKGVGGCRDSAGCPTPAATAWASVYRWMVGSRMTRGCAASRQGVWSCELTNAAGEQHLVVWDATQSCAAGACSTRAYAAPAGYTKYESLDGQERAVSGGTVPLGSKPIRWSH